MFVPRSHVPQVAKPITPVRRAMQIMRSKIPDARTAKDAKAQLATIQKLKTQVEESGDPDDIGYWQQLVTVAELQVDKYTTKIVLWDRYTMIEAAKGTWLEKEAKKLCIGGYDPDWDEYENAEAVKT